jgi:ABC-type polysaccharide/polyol phosphate export permease
LLSVGQVLLKDVAQAVGLLLMVWFYATPIIYPSEMVPDRFALLRDANPLGLLVDGHRWMLLAGEPPGAAAWLWFAGLVGGLLVSGVWFFSRMRPTLADEL